MADVRKEGPFFITLRRIYREKRVGFGRTLLFAEGTKVRADEVEKHGLKVADEKPAPKAKKK